ncbi:MAG TPA: NADH-quinone oxidoreductase subunit J [Candidatus Dormibacteraeota bacterium]|nr:NADH-quinone oxidoreductase subunit J [Candidatus Dormibacteraeota bacterium]
MSLTTFLVYVAGFAAGVGAVGVVFSQHALYSALWLVANMVSLAVLFLLLNAQFLAAVQVIIYAGAVMVLFVFIIALLEPGSETEVERGLLREGWVVPIGLVAVAGITILVAALALNGTTYDKTSGQLHGQRYAILAQPDDTISFQYDVDSVNANGNVQTAGGALFTRFLLPFEVTSGLLLVAAIGAVYLTRRRIEEA